MQNLVLYMPKGFPAVGGVQRLIVNIAKEFAQNNKYDCECLVFCERDTYVAQEIANINSPKIQLRLWDEGNFVLPENSLLLVWAGYKTVQHFHASNPRILMWCVYPGQSVGHLRIAGEKLPIFRKIFKNSTRRVIRGLVKKSAIASMDRKNLQRLRDIVGSDIIIPFLPIALPIEENRFITNFDLSKLKGKPLRLAWIGRGEVMWKVYPIIQIIRTANLPEEGVILTIYTDNSANYEREFSKLIRDDDIRNKVNITYRINVSGADLRQELAKDFDLSLGMGLSVLEGASVGVPSIYVGPQNDLDKGAYWQWGFEREISDFGYSAWHPCESENLDLKKIARDRGQLIELSKRCHDYVSRIHSMGKLVDNLVEWQSSARLSDYLKSHGYLYRALERFHQS